MSGGDARGNAAVGIGGGCDAREELTIAVFDVPRASSVWGTGGGSVALDRPAAGMAARPIFVRVPSAARSFASGSMSIFGTGTLT
jgi:hypothetical protein